MDKFIKALRYVLILIFIVWIISWLSINGHHKQARDRNFFNNLVIDAGNLPSQIKQYIITFNKPHQAVNINDKSLVKIGEFVSDSVINDSLYLLYYKYLGASKGKVILQNIKNGDTVFTWDIPLNTIMNDQIKKNDKYDTR